ncbi:AbrB family transcriptional regulator [uncultured Pelagimonas sp.]|uniref:AbrB family transcriptional regulator n=1 Tax=uncultured Pelagimonas sp. TaxID=1618102 RepID=UPI0026017BAE|nr:AbrB family transcriptional regulator [uncultured Pelagimonas sp.]
MTSDNAAMGIVLCLLAGCAGAFVFAQIGMPAAALTGSALAVSLVCLAGARMELPALWRDLLFLVLGINIGSGATSETLQAAVKWPLTISILSLSVIATLLLSRWVLSRQLGYDRTTAMLASTPGHLSFVLGIATDRNIDTTPIAIIQSTRVLFITLVVPVVVTWGFGDSLPGLTPVENMSLWHLAGLAIAAVGLGWVFQRLHFPAAYLLAGMVVSAAGHMSEITPGGLPWVMQTGAMVAMGALIGSRYSGVSGRDLRKALMGGLCVTSVGFAVTLLCVAISAWFLDISIPLLLIAFVPGGVEGMAAIAILLGMDPAFVAAHHLSRLFILSLIMPIWAKRTLNR